MHPAGNFLCRLRDVGKLHRIFRAWISPEPIPCGHAVVSNLPSGHGGFQKFEGRAQSIEKFRLGDFR